MGSVIAMLVFVFVAQTHAKKFAVESTNDKRDPTDPSVDDLLDRALPALEKRSRREDLEATTFGKPGQVAICGRATMPPGACLSIRGDVISSNSRLPVRGVSVRPRQVLHGGWLQLRPTITIKAMANDRKSAAGTKRSKQHRNAPLKKDTASQGSTAAAAKRSKQNRSAALENRSAARETTMRSGMKESTMPSGMKDFMSEPCNVVLTHTNADFDSLAGAVALAKLWSVERADLPTHVVIPRGVNPLVSRFLGFHKHLLPVRGFKTIRKEDISAVGIVDTQTLDRLGPAGAWVQAADHVCVVDHHTAVSGDIEPDELIIEPVGSATTVLVERIRALVDAPSIAFSSTGQYRRAVIKITEAEATLFALGIRADTGALSFPGTTPRDARALAWLMEHGCSQSAIAEFGQARLSSHQRDMLSIAMRDMDVTWHEGLKVGSVTLDTGLGFVTGMASVCQELLELLGCDVFVLGVVHANAKNQSFLNFIGRCSARAEGRAVDLNAVLGTWQGGGHRAAAAASVRLCSNATAGGEAGAKECSPRSEARGLIDRAVGMVLDQIPEQVRACDLMSKTIVACSPEDTMDHALAIMNQERKRAIPVLGPDRVLLGYLKYRDPIKAAQSNKGQQQVKAWMRRELLSVEPDMPLTEMEQMLLDGTTGRLHVVDDDRRLIGLVSRTDVLRYYQHYRDMDRDVFAPGTTTIFRD